MKINKIEHKGILQSCFIEKNAQGQFQQKTFTLDKMVDASGAYKKLLEGVDKKTGKFSDTEIEFTPGEIAILKQVFDEKAKKGFSVSDGEAALEVKALFDGK